MDDRTQYRQCELQSRDGQTRRVSWLPADFARVGSWVRVGVHHWNVISAFKHPVTMEFLGHVRDAQKDRASRVS